MWTAADTRRSRRYTVELIEMADQGLISWENLARDALGWMSEAEVEQFARRNDYIQSLDEDDKGEEDEDQ